MHKIRLTTQLSILCCFLLTILSVYAVEKQTVSAASYSINSSVPSTTANPQYDQVSDDHSRWIGEKLKAGNYKRLIIDAVVMNPLPEGLTSDEQARLEDLFTAFNQIFLSELSSKTFVVNTPGPGVARLQPTFTSISSSMRGVKIYEALPIAALLGGVKAVTGKRAREVELWLEAKVVDSQTNELLARIVRTGSADQADRKKATVEDVRKMLQEWAKESAMSATELFN